MWNNPQFNGMLNNPMNNMYNYNINIFNNQFINGYNPMNNNMFLNNNNNNFNLYNNNMMPFGNMSMNQMMLNQMTMNQNMMMYNMAQNNNNQMSNQSSLQDKMNNILNQYVSPVSNDPPKTVEEIQQSEEDEKLIATLRDVSNEPQPQRQNYENQNNQNTNHTVVDPTFREEMNSDKELGELFFGMANQLEGEWAHGENRGGKPYNPPDGWVGFGLNVLNKYDNGNNDWLACDGRPGEWCVAYHGACRGNSDEQIKQIIKPILQQNLRPGAGQACSGNSDIFHPGQTVGIGVYCSPNINTANSYAGTIQVRGIKYYVAFMLRVKPDKIRAASNDVWVLNAGNGDFSEIRPYRFLVKKC